MPNPRGNEQTLKKFKPKWKSGETQTIRVPVVLADSILSYAHQLDEGLVTSDQLAQVKSDQLAQVITWLEEVERTSRNNFSKKKKELVRQSIKELKAMSQVN